MTHKGFTLIELMIVVAIIGILAAVAIPQYQNYVVRAQIAEAFSLMSGAKTAVVEYISTTGEWPIDNAAAGLPAPTDISSKYVTGIWVMDCEVALLRYDSGELTDEVSPRPQTEICVWAHFNENAHTKLTDTILVLYGVDEGGSTSWSCGGESFNADETLANDITSYLPSSCDVPISIGGNTSDSETTIPNGTSWDSLKEDMADCLAAAAFSIFNDCDSVQTKGVTPCWNSENDRWEVGTNGLGDGGIYGGWLGDGGSGIDIKWHADQGIDPESADGTVFTGENVGKADCL